MDKRSQIVFNYKIFYILELQEAIGIDVGEGIIARYKEDSKEIVGLTIIGFK